METDQNQSTSIRQTNISYKIAAIKSEEILQRIEQGAILAS